MNTNRASVSRGRRTHLLASVPFLVLLAGSLPAQGTAGAPLAVVLQRLRGSPAEVAWAGDQVSEHRLHDAVPAVRTTLARFAGDDSPEGQYARLSLLDALLELDVRLPGEELLPHAVGCLRAPALVLAARSVEANAAYFAARMAATGAAPDLEWAVCGNLLAAQRAPGFAARCLREVGFVVEVVVTDELRPGGHLIG